MNFVFFNICVFVLALVRYFREDIDWNWTFAAILVAVSTLVAIVVYGAIYVFKGKERRNVRFSVVGDGDNDGDVDLDDDDGDNSEINNANDAATTTVTPTTVQSAFGLSHAISKRLAASNAV